MPSSDGKRPPKIQHEQQQHSERMPMTPRTSVGDGIDPGALLSAGGGAGPGDGGGHGEADGGGSGHGDGIGDGGGVGEADGGGGSGSGDGGGA